MNHDKLAVRQTCLLCSMTVDLRRGKGGVHPLPTHLARSLLAFYRSFVPTLRPCTVKCCSKHVLIEPDHSAKEIELCFSSCRCEMATRWVILCETDLNVSSLYLHRGGLAEGPHLLIKPSGLRSNSDKWSLLDANVHPSIASTNIAAVPVARIKIVKMLCTASRIHM